MIQDTEILKPVYMIGALCMATATCGILAFFFHRPQEMEFQIFIFVMVLLHLLTGIGILFRTWWGYYFLNFYLYCLLLAIPIGTLIAKKVLSHIRDNNLKSFFGVKSIEL